MKKKTLKLPGKGMRILSFIPAFNCFTLIYIGATNGNVINIICGAMYFFISMIFPQISFLLWIACIVHYSVAYKGIKKQLTNDNSFSQATTKPTYNTVPSSEHKFSDITIPGTEEREQAIPVRPSYETPSVNISFSYDSSRDKFFKDMKKYENKIGSAVPFEPFMTYWPTYESMSKSQQNWYFYWRTEVRKQNFIDTDLSYIFIYIYELLSEIGWKTAEEGYEKLLKVWTAYRDRFPKIDGYMNSWTFDFANLHNLEPNKTVMTTSLRLAPSATTDLLIDQYSSDASLKLPFDLIDALCDYSLVASKFYKDGNQSLMREAIPRIVALADAALRKSKNKGILELYGPNRPKKQEYYAFASAVCPSANQKIAVSVKNYSTSQKLRGYINELVRYAENTLRALNGYRGRLRGVTLDDETAKLVEAFLKKQYGNAKPSQAMPDNKPLIELDFSNIDILREQSDAVRTALFVEESDVTMEKELLTDVAEVSAIYVALTSGARELLDRLQGMSWECKQVSGDESLVTEINRVAEHYLGCNLLTIEENDIITEDDYRDELDFIYQNPPSLDADKENQESFSLEHMDETLSEFISHLVPEQRRALHCIILQDNATLRLAEIADDAMTMPQLLVDDINDVAIQLLGDIIIDQDLKITEEYDLELKKSIT